MKRRDKMYMGILGRKYDGVTMGRAIIREVSRRSAKRLRGKNGEEKIRRHRGGADEIFIHGAMIASRSNRRSLTTRPNPYRRRRSERGR
ncbi:hypothetical protein Bca4012_052976 [Brassica carinata]